MANYARKVQLLVQPIFRDKTDKWRLPNWGSCGPQAVVNQMAANPKAVIFTDRHRGPLERLSKLLNLELAKFKSSKQKGLVFGLVF